MFTLLYCLFIFNGMLCWYLLVCWDRLFFSCSVFLVSSSPMHWLIYFYNSANDCQLSWRSIYSCITDKQHVHWTTLWIWGILPLISLIFYICIIQRKRIKNIHQYIDKSEICLFRYWKIALIDRQIGICPFR